MLRKFSYYLEIATKDSLRARTTLISVSVVFAGMAVLLLVLTGLKQGLVQRLQDDLMRSPTAVTGNWFATSKDLALDLAAEKRLLASLPPGVKLIPDVTKVLTISTPFGTSEAVTVQATVPGDPALSFYGASITDDASIPEMVVSPELARELGISSETLGTKGAPAKILISREKLDRKEGQTTVELDVSIRWIVGNESDQSKTAYLSRYILEQIEDFTNGEAVIERGWPGISIDESIGCQGYLAFSKKSYSTDDLQRLHRRGFQAIDLAASDQPEDRANWINLYGLLRSHPFHVYFVTSDTQNENLDVFSRLTVEEVEAITDSDDVLLYWSSPTTAKIHGKEYIILGIAGSMRWLKSYFLDISVRMTGKDMKRVMFVRGGGTTPTTRLPLSSEQSITLTTVPTPPAIQNSAELGWMRSADSVAARISSFWRIDHSHWKNSRMRTTIADLEHVIETQQRPLAIVPPPLLAAIHQSSKKTLVFDGINETFQRVNMPNYYFSGRFCARVLADVPLIDEKLQSLGFSTVSSRLRVLEMQSYAGTLDLFTAILSTISFALGIVTASVLFSEITRRKQTAVGVMRIMGMPPSGVLTFVFIRAIIIGLLGWSIAVATTLLITNVLPLFAANAPCRLFWVDYAFVGIGSISCAAIGIAYSAYHAAFVLAPIDAIRLGKVQ